VTQHAGLTEERWKRFTLPQQILQIGAEMQRARSLFGPSEGTLLRDCYERALRLTDLTVRVQSNRSLRRELARWRGVVAELYLRDRPDTDAHVEAFRALLLLNGESATQLPYLDL
jgi:hypothetical protein